MKKTFKPMRLFCILMSLLLTLSLSACGNSQHARSQDDTSEGTAAPEESTAAPAEPADSAVVLYEETFDAYGDLTLRDGPNSKQGLSYQKRSNDSSADIKNGRLYLTGHSFDNLNFEASTEWSNYTAEADLCLENAEGFGGLMLRMDNETSMVVAGFSLDGKPFLNAYTSANLYAGFQGIPCDTGMQAGTVFRLKVTVNKNTATLAYALYDSEGILSDYEEVISVENAFPHMLLSGGVGLFATDGCSIWMDNVIVKEGEPHEAKSAVASIYIPESGIVNPPVVMQQVTKDTGLPATDRSPAVAILDVDANLNIVDGTNVLSTLDEYFAAYRDTVIPAFVIDSQKEVDALLSYLRINDVIDAFVLADSENWEILQNFRKNYGEIRGILRYEAFATPQERREAVILANTALANVVLSTTPLTLEDVTYFHTRAVSAWSMAAGKADVYNAISAGNDGIILADPTVAYDIYASITEVTNSGQPLPAAHRGHDNYSDNTAISIRKAVDEAGSRIAEIDLRLTKDNEIVLIHNASIDETTNGTGSVSQYTLEELKQFDVTQLGENTKIPTLEEVFQETLEDDIVFCCEMKETNETMAKRLNELIEQYNYQDRVMIFQGFGAIDNWNQEDYAPGVGYVAGQANSLLSTNDPLEVVENFLMYLSPYNNQPIFVSYETTAGPTFDHSNEDMYYMLTARGFCNWKSTTNGGKNVANALMTRLGAVAALTDDPELTLDFAYFIEAQDMELAVGKPIPMEQTLARIMYKEPVACEITQIDGPPLVYDEAKGTYTLNEPGTVTLVYHTYAITSIIDYDVYSAPITVTFQ